MNRTGSRKGAARWMAALLISTFLIIGYSPAASSRETTALPPGDLGAEVKIAGQPAGYYHEKTERSKDGNISTSIEMVITINRMNSKVEMRTSAEYRESPEGRLLALKSETSSSNQSTLIEVTVGDSALRVRTTTGDRSYNRKVLYKGTLVGQEALRRLSLAGLKSPGDKISFQTFMPELGTVASLTRKMIAVEPLTIEGREWRAIKVEDVVENLPGKTTVWLDRAGRLLRQVQDSPFGQIETIRASWKRAQAEEFSAGTLPAEAYARTLARSNIRLPHERSIERMKIRITHRKPELGWPDLEADNQKALEKTPASVVLEIRRPMLKAKAQRPVKSTPELAPFLRANPLFQSDDAGVQRILREMGTLNPDVFDTALALQRWTAENMQFDMGIALTPASEVARDRKGTCLAYAVLLGSLARDAGIPSRLRMGYVYVSGIWGGHAWVDVMVGNQWIPLDAAAYSKGPADAARFSAFTSSLEEGISAKIGALMQLYGNLDIRVLEYALKGRRVTVPPDARPYETHEDTYRNPWLGLTVIKPSSFHFDKLDAVWPDDTIVAMEGPQRQTVEVQKSPYSPRFEANPAAYLQQAGISGVRKSVKISGFSGVEIVSPGNAGLAFTNEDEVWVLKAKGLDASRWLHIVASRMKLTR